MEEEGSQVRAGALKPSPSSNSYMYRLYFKGLVTQKLSSGFGFAICDQQDNLLLQIKGPLHDSAITVLEADLTALKRGLIAALGLGIDRISIYCPQSHIYKLILGISEPQQDNITLLMRDVQRRRQQFSSSNPVMVNPDQVKFVSKLAMETLVSKVSETRIDIPEPDQKETCEICFNDDFDDKQMFSIGSCGHRFCAECMKKHIEVRLLEGSIPRCPYDRCESKLNLERCANLLIPKQREMWEQRINEESVPIADRVYCPYPKCSVLILETNLSYGVAKRNCFKCGGVFCINCKVPWHGNLTCNDYKRLGPNPTLNDIKLKTLGNKKKWRQCEKCKYMIELSSGCAHVKCRCGYEFCYTCGAQWIRGIYCTHSTTSPLPTTDLVPATNPPHSTTPWSCFLSIVIFLILLILYYMYLVPILKKVSPGILD